MEPSHADIVNTLFELGAGIVLWSHVRTLLKEKEVKGVSILPFAFYTVWGFWNLYYYPKIGQDWSFWGGIFVVLVNSYYTYLLYYYRFWIPRKKNELPTPN